MDDQADGAFEILGPARVKISQLLIMLSRGIETVLNIETWNLDLGLVCKFL